MIPRFLRRPWLVVARYPDRSDVVGRHSSERAAARRAHRLRGMSGYEGVPLRVRDAAPSWPESVARDEAMDRDARRAVWRSRLSWFALVTGSLAVAWWWPW